MPTITTGATSNLQNMNYYKPSKAWRYFIAGFHYRMDKIAKPITVLSIGTGIIWAMTEKSWLIYGFIPLVIFILFVLFRMGVQIAENLRVRKYCKENGVDLNEFRRDSPDLLE